VSRELIPVRGRCYLARRAGIPDPKPFLVVSGNRRNQALTSVLAVRITTAAKRPPPSIAELGAVTPNTMRRVERGLPAPSAWPGDSSGPERATQLQQQSPG
jgi:hypothetical protein